MENKITDWAQLRFSIIAGLLTRPPKKGQLGKALRLLAERDYPHPREDRRVRFGASTIERWYYEARHADDPVRALGRKVRCDAGGNRAMNPAQLKALGEQYRRFPHWSYQLHKDNLAVLCTEDPELGEVPSYSTVRRRMKAKGWGRKHRPKTAGQRRAAHRYEQCEVRSYEVEHVHALWHLDFHACGRRVVDARGIWQTPKALCVMDDRSRLCCHIQWYPDETAETLVHGLTQAFYKRGLPRGLMTDNGAAMLAGEIRNGLVRLGIEHELTLPYSPYQNGKQESFWGQLEGRMIAMLSGIESLDLDFLNRATQAWVEMEYNRARHRELNGSPMETMLRGPEVSRPCPDRHALRQAFTVRETRMQRRSDCTVQVKGIRFEVPNRFRHLDRLTLRFQAWDLRRVFLIDPRTDTLLTTIYPMDKVKNAQGQRRAIEMEPDAPSCKADSTPPLLRKLLADYAATGLPPAYIPKKDRMEEAG